MNKKLVRLFYLVLALLGIGVMVFCATQTVMAVLYSEWGRVVFYLLIAIFAVEITATAIVRLVRGGRKKHKYEK